MSRSTVIAGISTEVGKTIVAALLTEAWQADYWKPVQSGSATDSDTCTIRSLVSNKRSVLHREAYALKEPISPHAAAKLEGVEIQTEKIVPPATTNELIIELAGGLLTPLSDTVLNIDLIERWGFPVVLVIDGYLGSINHSLLSIEALFKRNIELRALAFNRYEGHAGKEVILHQAACPHFDIPAIDPLNSNSIKAHAQFVPTSI